MKNFIEWLVGLSAAAWLLMTAFAVFHVATSGGKLKEDPLKKLDYCVETKTGN